MLEIALFGEPRFIFEGRPHAFAAPPKSLPLLAYLLLQRNVRLLRENVAGLLWPDDDEETARANLRRHIHYVRQALPQGDWVLADRAAVQWNANAPWRLDVADFEQQSRVPALRAAATRLYAGDLYGSCDEEWLYFERERLRNIQLANLSALAHESERLRDHAGVAAHAQALLTVDPWREDALRMLMRARMQNGDRAGALAEYDRFRARLLDEMAVEPMRETVALYETFSRERQLAPFVQSGDAQAIVGRDSERDALLRLWRAARVSRGGLVLIGGDAGVGKTTLLQSFARQAEREGARVLAGEVTPDTATPYAPVAEAIGQLAKSENRSPLAGEHGNSIRLFGAVAEALSAAAAQQPILVTLEDLHWATADAIALIEYLARTCRDLPILIAASYRENDLGPQHPLRSLRRVLSGRAWFTAMVVNPLDREAADQLVRRHLGVAFRPDVAERLFERTQGNAFFLVELLERVAAGDTQSVPSSVRALVLQRIARLSSDAVQIAKTLSANAAPFEAAFASAVCGLSGNALAAGLQELEDARILKRARDGQTVEYAFVHDVVRHVLYEDLSDVERPAIHVRIAGHLAKESGNEAASAAVLASHLERAEHYGLAAEAYARAAEFAAAKFALEDAEAYARKAVALSTDDGVRIRATSLLCDVYYRKGPPASRRAAVEEFVRLSERAQDSQLLCEALSRRIELAAQDDVAALPALVSRLEALIPDTPLWNARLKLYRSTYLFRTDAADRAWEYTHEARASFLEAGDLYGQLYCDIRLLELAERHGRPYAGILSRARDLAARIAGGDAAFLVDDAEAKIFLHRDRTMAQHAASRMLERSRSVGDRGQAAIAHAYLGAVDTYRFDVESAHANFAAAQAILEEHVSRPIEYARFLRFRGLLGFATGDVESGLGDSLQALSLARRERAWQLVATAAGNAAYGYRLSGNVAAGTALAEEVAALFGSLETEYFDVHHMRMELHVQYCVLGRFDEGIPVIRESYEAHEASGLTLHAAWIGGELMFQLLRAGRIDEAREFAERVLELLPAVLDEGWMPQEVLWRAALVLRASGDAARASALVERAAALVGRRAAAIADEEGQRRFLQAGVNPEIVRAHAEHRWPAPQGAKA